MGITAGQPLRLFRAGLAKALNGATEVLDIGTEYRFRKELRPVEHWFKDKNYQAAGFAPRMDFGEYNCDLDLDVCRIDLPDASFDCVICLEVLEHVDDPFAAARELQRILRPGGALFLTVPFLNGYHGNQASKSAAHGDFPDYWRFTHQGLQKLFAALRDLEVTPLNGPIEFRLRFTPFVRWIDRAPLRQVIDRFDRPRLGGTTTRHMLIGRR
jgi:SAM-dependent methyltransferase